jgi:hypothetical protein
VSGSCSLKQGLTTVIAITAAAAAAAVAVKTLAKIEAVVTVQGLGGPTSKREKRNSSTRTPSTVTGTKAWHSRQLDSRCEQKLNFAAAATASIFDRNLEGI